jgi:hypothetical protein
MKLLFFFIVSRVMTQSVYLKESKVSSHLLPKLMQFYSFKAKSHKIGKIFSTFAADISPSGVKYHFVYKLLSIQISFMNAIM